MQTLPQSLRDRLSNLIEQVRRDRAALDPAKHPDGDRAYARLFDSLQSTLHNLTTSAEAEPEPRGGVS
jgi:hypothetical protein